MDSGERVDSGGWCWGVTRAVYDRGGLSSGHVPILFSFVAVRPHMLVSKENASKRAYST